jgi:hypothetical protein
MGHIDLLSERSSSNSPTWLGVGRMVGELTREWSGRYDLVGYAGSEAGSGAVACFRPALAEVELNVVKAFGPLATPETVGDLLDRKTQYKHAKAIGVLMHESYHAKFSQWDIAKAGAELSPEVFGALHNLEEGRIENYGILENPTHRAFLRSAVFEIIMEDAKESLKERPTIAQATHLVSLIHGRVESGVFKEEDIEEINDLCVKIIGAERLESLRDIMRRFQGHEVHDQADPVLYRLAEEWVAVARGAQEDAGEQPGESGEGQGGAGESSELSEEVREALGELKKAIQETQEKMEIQSQGELGDQETEEDWQDEVQARSARAKQKQISEKTASRVFSKSSSAGEFGGTSSSLVETRQPTSRERSAAVVISRMLEKAKYRDRDVTEVSSITPPGRLRTRALVQGKAMEARGVRQQVEPWRKTVRRQTDEPKLNVGVMVDISGSMRAAMEPMATTAWVMSEAVRRVQGRTAMVYYGNTVFPTLKPGQHLNEVRVYSAADSTEEFEEAFLALDGALNLLHGSGARMLVVVSDGYYRYDMEKKVVKILKECKKANLPILWLPFDAGHSLTGYKRYADISVLDGVKSPASAATEIGKEAARLLTEAGSKSM